MKSARLFLLAEIAVIGAVALVACNRTATGPDAPATPAPSIAIIPPPTPTEKPTTPAATPALVTIFAVENGGEGQGQRLVQRTVPGKGEVSDSAVSALNEMAEGNNSPLPSGTKALSVKFAADGTATADFNTVLRDNFPGGDEKEALTLNAILATVGQFPGVKKVQITVAGEKVGLGGTQDTTEPLPIPSPVGVRVSKREGQP